MDQVKVSIVVPVYNVEKYLDKCIKSILKQTLKEIEIVLINDGSTDSSKEICEKYANNDNRIRLINKENSGLSATRNEGVKYCTGEYIYFMDSDDWIEENCIAELYFNAKKINAEISMCGFKVEYEQENLTFIKEAEQLVLKNREEIAKYIIYIIESIGIEVVWNKLYLRDFLEKNSLYFKSNALIVEDLEFNCNVLKLASSITVSSKSLYHYMRYEGTILSRFQKNLYENNIRKLRYESCKQLLDSYRELDKNAKKHIADKYYLSGTYEYIYNLFRKDCTLSSCEKIEVIKREILDDTYGRELAISKCDKNVIEKITATLLCINNPIIFLYTYKILFYWRNTFKKIYIKFRKNFILLKSK